MKPGAFSFALPQTAQRNLGKLSDLQNYMACVSGKHVWNAQNRKKEPKNIKEKRYKELTNTTIFHVLIHKQLNVFQNPVPAILVSQLHYL